MKLGGDGFEQFSTSDASNELALPLTEERSRARNLLREVTSMLAARPWLLSTVVLVAVAAVTSPWGNYPVNDDWQYARAVEKLAARGELVIDTDIAPSLLGALFFTWPFVKAFGFSHVLLRILTMGLAALTLFALDELMRLGEVARHFRARILVLLAINPLFVNLAFSFMTEFYGFTPALLGAVIWFRTRRAHAASDGALVGLLPAIASGAVIGGTFWVRQYCVLIFPALVASTLLYVLKTRDWRRLWRSLPALVASGTAFLALVGGYFWYAKTHNLVKGAFEGRLQDTLHFSLLDYQIMGGAYGFYLTAFLFPLLLTWPLSTRRLSRYTRAGAAAFALALALVTIVELRATDDWASLGVHRVFPYLSNIIHNAGVGPNTLTDGFFYRNDKYYAVSRTFWRNVSYGLLGLSALWGFALVALASLRNAPRARRELAAFGSAFAALSLVAVVQAYGGGGFDRYSLPCLFGIVLVLGSLASSEEESIHRPLRVRNLIRKWSAVPFALTCLPLAYFTVAGVHDYFRWNDARWRLVDYALSTGFPSTSINGGYEVNGWLSYDATGLHAVNPDVHRCIGECRCEVPAVLAGLWNCFDDSYRINMSVGPGYDEVMRETPRFWFGRDHSIILSKRRQ